jgi:hypothetical protein
MNSLLQEFLKQIKDNIDNSTLLPPVLSNVISEYISIPKNVLSMVDAFDAWMKTNITNQWDKNLLDNHNKALIEFCSRGEKLITYKTYEEFCLFSDLVKLKGYNINIPVFTSIDFDIAKKFVEISRDYYWVGLLISGKIIKKEEVCSYSQETLQALNYWGVYTLMIDKSTKLTLNKALTLTPEQAGVFDMSIVNDEVRMNKLSIDEAIQKYICNVKLFGIRRF